MIRFVLFAMVVLLGPATLLSGSEPQASSPEQKVNALIDQLVSPNPKPITRDEDKRVNPDYRLPGGFDRDKQEPIYQARLKLKGLGRQAFPFLIEQWSDKRFSITVRNMLSGYCRNQTVGDVCRILVFDQIQPYGYWQANGGSDPRNKPLRPRYPEKFLSSQEAANTWWEKHKEDSLDQIQLEVLDWVIAEEARTPEEFSDEERERLQRVRQKLTTDKKPLPPGNYYMNEIAR